MGLIVGVVVMLSIYVIMRDLGTPQDLGNCHPLIDPPAEWYVWYTDNVILFQASQEKSLNYYNIMTHVATLKRLPGPKFEGLLPDCVSYDRKYVRYFTIGNYYWTDAFLSLTGQDKLVHRDNPDLRPGIWSRDNTCIFTCSEDEGPRFWLSKLSFLTGTEQHTGIALKKHLDNARIAGWTGTGNLVVYDAMGFVRYVSRSTIELLEIDTTRGKVANTIRIVLPSSGDVVDASISPNCKKLAIVLHSEEAESNSALRWLNQLFHIHPKLMDSLWEVDIDGRQPICLGTRYTVKQSTESLGVSVSDVKWSPNGARLSFFCNGKLRFISAK